MKGKPTRQYSVRSKIIRKGSNVKPQSAINPTMVQNLVDFAQKEEEMEDKMYCDIAQKKVDKIGRH